MKQIVVTAGVITKNGLVLMSQRLPGGSAGGKWEFPGGKVELGEDPRVCLQRELAEELGIQAQAGQVLEVVSQTDATVQLILIYFACQIIQGEPQAIQCQQVAWFTAPQIEQLEKPAADNCFWEKYRHWRPK